MFLYSAPGANSITGVADHEIGHQIDVLLQLKLNIEMCQYSHVNAPPIFTHTAPAIFSNTVPLSRRE